MKAKLIKKDGHYFLEVEPNTWKPANRFHSIIANTLDKKEGDVLQLSLKNCQSIELGYDLDELSMEMTDKEHPLATQYSKGYKKGIVIGFQKALELMGDKKFSEEDIHEAYYLGDREDRSGFHDLLHLKQQTEWDVEIEMWFHGTRHKKGEWMPKLDADGCLILKLKSE